MKGKKKVFIYLIPLLFSLCLFGQTYNIDYYGIVSKEIDSNMAKMTSDLYFTQLSEINNFSVSDKRDGVLLNSIPDNSIFSENKLSFFTEIIKEEATDKWIAKFYVVDKSNQLVHSKEKKYDSYYKVLMESKNELRENIKQLIENESKTVTTSKTQNSSSFEQTNKINELTTTEVLAGTWSGEDNIEKVVILRGGRGFVIFKNGASMNISVELKDNKILITQKGKGNASFYPELPRNLALTAALDSEPIQWTLLLDNQDLLSGTKKTLLPDGENYTSGTLNISWKRIN